MRPTVAIAFPFLVASLLSATPILSAASPFDGPRVHFESTQTWFGSALLLGTSATAAACPGTEPVIAATLKIFGVGSDSRSGAECFELTVPFSPSAPGQYRGEVHAEDGQWRLATDMGRVDVHVFPRETSSVAGFPPLETLPAPAKGAPVFFEALVAADGSVRASRVAFGGETAFDTMTSVYPESTDSFETIELDAGASIARVIVDSIEVWSGPVAQADEHWWHLRVLPPRIS